MKVKVRRSHHDGNERADDWEGGADAKEDLRECHVEGRLQRLDGVRQRDGHRSKGQVGRNVAHRVHRRRAEDLAELVLCDRLQTPPRHHPPLAFR